MENRKPWPVILLVCVLAACSHLVCWAQAASSGFSLEQVMSSPFPTNLVSAQQTARIAWQFTTKGEHNVWVADAPGFEARHVTHYTGDDGLPLAALKLTPDGRTAVYARVTEANSAGEIADPTSGVEKRTQQVWAVA